MVQAIAFTSWSRKLRVTSQDKHQCTRLGSVPNLNSQASSPSSSSYCTCISTKT